MPFNERSVQLGIFELHIHFDEDINYEGNISGGNSSLLPPENPNFCESVRGNDIIPWWANDGSFSNDHGCADGSGGRNDFDETCRFLRGR